MHHRDAVCRLTFVIWPLPLSFDQGMVLETARQRMTDRSEGVRLVLPSALNIHPLTLAAIMKIIITTKDNVCLGSAGLWSDYISNDNDNDSQTPVITAEINLNSGGVKHLRPHGGGGVLDTLLLSCHYRLTFSGSLRTGEADGINVRFKLCKYVTPWVKDQIQHNTLHSILWKKTHTFTDKQHQTGLSQSTLNCVITDLMSHDQPAF